LKGKLIPMLGLAVVFGGISIFVADKLVKNKAGANQPAVIAAEPQKVTEFKKIVVARAALRYGMELNSDQLSEIDWPSDSLPDGAFASIADLTSSGRRIILSPVEPNEPILAAKLSGANGRATLANLLAPGKRAVTIRVDDISGVAGFVTPGDRVDVVLTRQQQGGPAQVAEGQPQTAAPSEFASEVILADIKVLTADQNSDERALSPGVAKAVTVEVSTEEAQKVALAQQIGTLYLLLRSAGDQTNADGSAVTASDLGGSGRDMATVAALPKASLFGLPKDKHKFRTLTVTRGHVSETFSVVEELRVGEAAK
jgi:pilus assembly protein CpaB